MLRPNFNRLVFFLIINILLILAGCAPKQSISYAIPEQPIQIEKQAFSNNKQLTEQTIQVDPSPSTQLNEMAIWDRLFKLYSLPEINNRRIDVELKRYLKHPNYLVKIQKRAAPYLYAIIEEIEAKNLPGEFALLPVVESAFKPDAYSSSKAAGIWQFIPSTGRFFGLQQNWWYDGRRDVHTSTIVATNYLKDLSRTFDGDWLLALASYNAGKGTVAKAIRKNKRLNKPTDYWSLSLSKEARQYVPRLLAVAKIFANADKYNLKLLPIPNQPAFEKVDVASQLDLTVAAKLADTPLEQFIHLNPGFKRWCTAPNGPHHLLIPVDKADIFKQNLSQLADQDRMLFKYREPTSRHRIRSGENLGSIAKKYDCTVQDIRQFNQLKSNNIIAGQFLFIPASNQEINDYLKGNTNTKNQNKIIYMVKKGDSLWSISQKFSVATTSIIKWNKISKSHTLYPGQKLIIKPSNSNWAKTPLYNPFHTVKYTVKKGDSLSNISRKFNVPMKDLRKWNAIDSSYQLKPGQQLKVIVNSIPST